MLPSVPSVTGKALGQPEIARMVDEYTEIPPRVLERYVRGKGGEQGHYQELVGSTSCVLIAGVTWDPRDLQAAFLTGAGNPL